MREDSSVGREDQLVGISSEVVTDVEPQSARQVVRFHTGSFPGDRRRSPALNTRRKIFVSYATGDKPFAPLVVALLEHHGHVAWSATTDLQGGNQFRERIDDAIKTADTMIVIVGQSTVRSKWVTREIAAFRTARPDGPIIPVMLDSVSLDRVMPGLEDNQAVDFRESMLTGFQNLFSTLNTGFLHRDLLGWERRNGDDRRRLSRRRVGLERRTSGAVARMRVGFWLAYSRETRKAEFEQVKLLYSEIYRMKDALLREAVRYEFRDARNRIVTPKRVMGLAADALWVRLRDFTSKEAVLLVELFAEWLFQQYAITMIDRRANDRRRAANRRVGIQSCDAPHKFISH